MKTNLHVHLDNVQEVYSGPEADLWELVMGEQIHVGGLASSMDLAERADIGAGTRGIDLCCCTGAGMRFLVRFRGVAGMLGVDATPRMVERGRARVADEGLAAQVDFLLGDVCNHGLPTASADFVWGEDAWCYVEDKQRLIAEAVRLVRPGGVVAFTDWMEGAGLSDAFAQRFLTFMKFPTILTLEEYARLLRDRGCEIVAAVDTGRFPSHVDLYLQMLNMQLTYDALKIIGFDQNLMQAMADEMTFMQHLAHDKKIIQGLIVARKP